MSYQNQWLLSKKQRWYSVQINTLNLLKMILKKLKIQKSSHKIQSLRKFKREKFLNQQIKTAVILILKLLGFVK